MNVFRLVGDLLHLVSFFLLLWKIHVKRSCVGISLKSQILYAIVFSTRYLDLFFNFLSLYNSIMKVVFIGVTYAIIFLMMHTYRASYDRSHDTFRLRFALIPCAVMALLVNAEFSFFEILWTFSIYLEAVAILPQLFLLHRTERVGSMTSDYVFTLGGYRAFYILNWIYRYITEPNYVQWIVWISGVIQTLLYADFFYYYALSKWYGKELMLPK